MKKAWLLLGVGLGFVLGLRAGRAPYERLKSKARELARRPEVKRVVDAASDKASDLHVVGEAAISDLENSFPSSDPPSNRAAGPDKEPIAQSEVVEESGRN
jgi:hypothetical protein